MVNRSLKNLSSVIDRARMHENRLKLHSIPEQDANAVSTNPAFTRFLAMAEKLVPKDKYRAIINQITYPLVTTGISASIYSSLERVFQAKNAVEDFYFKAPEQAEDWANYRSQVLREPQIWQSVGFNKMKTAINSLLVVDMPSEPKNNETAPYFYWLDIALVVELDHVDGVITRLVYKTVKDDIDVYLEYTDAHYASYADPELTKNITLNEHGLGYCPATFFWQTPVDVNEPLLKASPLTKQLGNLDKFLFKSLSVDYFDLYASYPIVSKWAEDCDYHETGERYNSEIRCDGGYLRDDQGYLRDGEHLKRCPACGNSSLAGPGSVIEVPLVTDNGLNDDATKVNLPGVTLTTVDSAALDYNAKKLESMEASIIDSVAGVSTANTSEAINEMQVKSKFEDKVDVLRDLKKNFEAAQRFIDDTICRLRYGDNYLGLTIDWGTEFYLEDSNTLYNKLKAAKEAGLPEYILTEIQDDIVDLEYKNNPTMLNRMRLLKQIEPYPNMSRAEVLSSQLLDADEITLKLNLPALVARFESENTAITEFGLELDINKRIEIIKQTLLSYVHTKQD